LNAAQTEAAALADLRGLAATNLSSLKDASTPAVSPRISPNPISAQAPVPAPLESIGGNAQAAPAVSAFPLTTYAQVRECLLSKREIALVDVREEDPFAQSHPLFACNMPIGRIEADAYRRIPRKDTLIVIYDQFEGLAERAAHMFTRLGYTQVTLLEGGLAGWAAAGGELFKDVNVPSKAFGEWVEAVKHTPSLSAQEVKALLDQKADVVVMDARRFDEYQTMSIPGAVSVPGAELALRARTLAPKPTTRIIVNCAGRTRSIIGTQSLVNAGIPNPVSALRNGTIGWMLAGQELAKGASQRFPEPAAEDLAKAQASALALSFRCGIKRIDWQEYMQLKASADRTTYLFDVRTPEEYAKSHLEGAISAPGGQLVQETDHNAPVRGARIVLYDCEGVRAFMSGSWLVQLGWEVHVIKNIGLSDLKAPSKNEFERLLPKPIEPVEQVSASQLKEWLANRTNLTVVIDVGESAQYVKRHIPGAWWILRSQIEQDFSRIHKANRYVLTCSNGHAARYAVHEIKKLIRPGVQVAYLSGGNEAWFSEGFSTQQGESYVVSPRIDRYRRPYEGTSNPAAAMQAYLDWEFGLIEQLKRDGTHGFKVI
jgi:rhodanese-related sulfurtransferase